MTRYFGHRDAKAIPKRLRNNLNPSVSSVRALSCL
jgi:hypothetical protein